MLYQAPFALHPRRHRMCDEVRSGLGIGSRARAHLWEARSSTYLLGISRAFAMRCLYHRAVTRDEL